MWKRKKNTDPLHNRIVCSATICPYHASANAYSKAIREHTE